MNGQRDMIAFLVLYISAVSGEYLFTLPRIMEAGSTTYFCLVLKDVEQDGFILQQGYVVKVDLDFSLGDKTSMSRHTSTFGRINTDGDFQTCDIMTAPLDPGTYSTNVNVSLTYTPSGNYTETTVQIFVSKKDVTVYRPELITLIQTDKPIYKPGQTVKFRVMTMDYTLMAKTDGYQQITIETPAGLRVMQWDDVPSPYGLISLEMPLSSDPVLGSWKIKVLYGSKDIQQAFKVDEYVLPKFEVTVTPPKYLLPTTQTIHGTVCAKYTYGKPVKGELKMSICYNVGYYYTYRAQRPCTHIIEKIDGCYEFFIPAEDIELGHRTYSSWGKLNIDVTVTEEQTGIELSGESEGPRMTMYPLNLKLEDDTNNYFKPGFPYKARVIVTNPDGSPAPGELILVEGSSYTSDFTWSNNFTTDVNGIVHFVITDLDSDVGSLRLHANAVVYENDWRYTTDELYFRTYTPQAFLQLTKWYSPSNSYMYIPDVDQAAECDSELMLDVYYSAEMGDDYKFTAIVKAGDRVMYTMDHAATTDSVYNLNILSVDNSQVLIKAPKPTHLPVVTLPPLPSIPQLPDDPELPAQPVPDAAVETTADEGVIEELEQDIAEVYSETLRRKRDIGSNLIGHFKLALPIYQDMGPNAKLLVFYMRKDKEIIATSLGFNIKNCFNNKVSMTFDETTVRPGTDVNLNLSASPNSRCFVGMVDKSVNLLGGKNQLTPSQVFENVRRVARPYHYTSYWVEDRDYCSSKQPPVEGEQDYYYYGRSNPNGVDAIQAFRDAGMWVETDGVLETRPCTEMKHYYYSYMRGPGGRDGAPVPLASGISDNYVLMTTSKIDKSEPEAQEKIRSFFPETWLWEIVKLGDDGKLEWTTTIPDTITEWVGNALCTHATDGIGVTELTGITAFQPFFVSMTLPYSAIRSEVLPLLVTVFNYLPDCIALEVELRSTEGFTFTNSEGSSRQFCLCGGESQSTKFHIMPIIVGEIDLEVIAVSTDNAGLCDNMILSDIPAGVSDGVQRQLLIEAEGVPQDLTKSSYVCVHEGDTLKEMVEMNLPADMVQDSERAVVSVVGDIMGPTLSNLKNLLRMPYGCGEQNMASWSPNIYVLQYLANTDQLNEELESEAEGYMRVGYQRQMKYRHNDNSYSAWGENNHGNATGSLWLTAFVVKSMAQSSAYIAIDMDDIVRSARWLVSKQIDGCYPQIGKVFSSYLKGGFDGDNPAGLTAFTLIALLEAEPKLGEEYKESIGNGFTLCLDKFEVQSTDTYTLTVMSYAYTLYDIDGQRRAAVMNELQARRVVESGLEFWRREDGESPVEPDYRWWYRAPSAEVEMTAYVLLSLLAEGPGVIGRVQPIVQWVTKQRNPYGGFSSTQDTVVALQALAKFGEMTYTDYSSVRVEIKNSAIDHVFIVTPNNSLVYQSQDVSPQHGAIEISTSGIGCALVQMNMKYNIYKEDNYAEPAFEVNVMAYKSKRHEGNCGMRMLLVCARYLKSGGVSNMAIAEVKMPTGWTPVKNTLQELMTSGMIQKYEIEKNYVEIYFDELTRDKVCIDFDVEQEIRMNPKPSLMKVYDYYETRYSVTTEYEIKTTCGTKQEIPLDNAGLDCNIVQCRVDTVRWPEVQTCPRCLETIDKTELEVLTCDSHAVYKARVGRSGTYSMKLKSNLLPKQKVTLGKFVNYKMAGKCSCPKLEAQSETGAIIFTSNTALLTMKDEDEITLDAGDTVIPFTLEYEDIIRKLATRKNLCAKLKRLRRSGRPDSQSKLQRLRRKYGVL